MRTSLIATFAAVLASAAAFPQLGARQEWTPQEWIAPGPDDCKSPRRYSPSRAIAALTSFPVARGPCPGLNTLANHGYLPRNGKEISLDILKDAMLEGFNIEHADAILLFTQAIRTSPKFPLTRTFDLADLGRHGILEHDISLR